MVLFWLKNYERFGSFLLLPLSRSLSQMVAYLLLLCFDIKWTYCPHFGLDILLHFARLLRGHKVSLASTQKIIKLNRHYERDL